MTAQAAADAKTALVTGASRGIGRAIALALGRAGLEVVGTATGDDGARAISGFLDGEGVRGHGAVLRVEQADSVAALLKTLAEQDQMPDVLVNNAGITRDSLLPRMSDEDWDAVINTNLGSVFRLSKACVRRMMKKRWGRIINITSLTGAAGNPGQANYAAAKAGITGFSKSLAKELGTRNITVNCVAPGFIDTDMVRALPEKYREEIVRTIPAARFGEAAEVAELVRFLASGAAAYITGETVHINGGLYMA